MISALDHCRNDHTIAIEAEFSEEFDSHLVSVQTRDGRCHTQAIKIDSRPRTSKCFGRTEWILCNGYLYSIDVHDSCQVCV